MLLYNYILQVHQPVEQPENPRLKLKTVMQIHVNRRRKSSSCYPLTGAFSQVTFCDESVNHLDDLLFPRVTQSAESPFESFRGPSEISSSLVLDRALWNRRLSIS